VFLSPGFRLGSHEITASLGEGGMGEVYRATDTRLKRTIAIKVLPAALTADRDRLVRFEREAQLLASLNHPNIAHVYGFESAALPDGSSGHFIAMELVEGEDLAERLQRGPIPIDESIAIAKQIAEALEEAHEHGIVHRDLKPANVKVTPDGRVKVLDFGLAKAMESTTHNLDVTSAHQLNSPTFAFTGTQVGAILGTAAYMAPEQARGKPVDKRADIWAFGALVYEMLTGRLPFPGETVTDVIAAIVKNDPDWSALPSGTPPRIRRLLVRCLQKDPRARLRDIGDARLDLDDRDAVVETSAPPVSRPRLAQWIALTALIALAAGGAAGALWPRTAARSAPNWRAALVGGPANLLQPVLSPDGQQLAFQTIVDGQTQIGVMKADGGTWRVLTSDRTRGLSAIHDWSPDGSRIFYDRQTDTLNGVFAVPSLGGDERLVLENAGFPVALPNGDLLVQRVNANRQSQLHRFSPATGRLDALPAIPDSSLSDDSVVVSTDGRLAYYFGQPLDDLSSPPAFHKVDLQSGRNQPVPLPLDLAPPVSLAFDRQTGDLYVGGVDGDAFQIVRVPAAPGAPPEPLLTLPDAARIEVDRRGGLFVAVRSRPAELFTFPMRPSPDRPPLHLETLPMVNARKSQTLVPLPDGRCLVSSRSGERDRILVVQAGKRPSLLVDGDEETRAPATAVGPSHAAVMMGAQSSPDIAIVNTTDGRLVRRFKAPTPAISTLAASPDGRTLYYAAAGSVWALPATGGTPAKLGDGDSFTVDPDTGDLVVKLDEGARMRLVRLPVGGGRPQEIAVRSDLRLVPRPLVPGAVRQGRLLLPVASTDSWFWHAAMLDLKTGVLTKLADSNPSDFHFVTWRADGVPIGLGYGIDTALWHFTARSK
jgi:hypothetical protein